MLTHLVVACGAAAGPPLRKQINLRKLDEQTIGVSFDETTTLADVDTLFRVLNCGRDTPFSAASLAPAVDGGVGAAFERSSSFLQQPIFNTYHNEHDMLRWDGGARGGGGGGVCVWCGVQGLGVLASVRHSEAHGVMMMRAQGLLPRP